MCINGQVCWWKHIHWIIIIWQKEQETHPAPCLSDITVGSKKCRSPAILPSWNLMVGEILCCNFSLLGTQLYITQRPNALWAQVSNTPQNYSVQCFLLPSILAAVRRRTVDYLSPNLKGAELNELKTFPHDAVCSKGFQQVVKVFKRDLIFMNKAYFNRQHTDR